MLPLVESTTVHTVNEVIQSIIVTKCRQRPAGISDKKNVNRTITIFYDIQDPSKVQKITEFTFSIQFGLMGFSNMSVCINSQSDE